MAVDRGSEAKQSFAIARQDGKPMALAGIPLETLRDWEQGAKKPDQEARAYLRAIAGDPVAVLRALHAPARQPG